MSRRRFEWCPFAGQRRSTIALTVLGGVLAFGLAYRGTAILIGPADGAVLGHRATAVGAVACWTYFAVATILGRGAPIPNVVFLPGAIVAVGSPVAGWLVLGDPDVAVGGGARLFSASWRAGVVTAVVPGIAAAGVVLVGWFYGHLDATGRRRWVERHVPAACIEEFRARADRVLAEWDVDREGEGGGGVNRDRDRNPDRGREPERERERTPTGTDDGRPRW